jgi:hypothetical protein
MSNLWLGSMMIPKTKTMNLLQTTAIEERKPAKGTHLELLVISNPIKGCEIS